MAKFVGGSARMVVSGGIDAVESLSRGYSGTPYVSPLSCDGCGCSLTRSRMWYIDMQRLASGGSWCMNCAGFIESENRFKTLEDYIRESLPTGLKDMPTPILADYLEENGAAAADWIRNHTSGG